MTRRAFLRWLVSVVVALRLLPRGAGAFTTPVFPTTALTSASDGGWTQAVYPVASYAAGLTFFGYLDGSNGNVEVRSYDHATGSVSSAFVLHAALEVDSHDNPAIHVRASDQRLMAVYTKHDIEDKIYLRISTNPLDVSAWGAETVIDPGGLQYTYPTVVEVGGGIRIYYRDVQDAGTTGVLCVTESIDNGVTWSAQTELYQRVNKLSYWVIRPTGSRVDFLVNDGHPITETPKLFHFWEQGGVYHKTDGTVVTPLLAPADLTEIDDGASGTCEPYDIALVAGNPVASYVRIVSSPTDNRLMYATYAGSWSKTQVVACGGDAAIIFGGIVIDPQEPTTVYTASKDSGTWEIARRSYDGSSWTVMRNLTAASANPNLYPHMVRSHVGDLKVLWSFGTYTTYLVNALGTKGGG